MAYRNVDVTTAEMRKLLELGYNNRTIAEKFGCSPATVYNRLGRGSPKRCKPEAIREPEATKEPEAPKAQELRAGIEVFHPSTDCFVTVYYDTKTVCIGTLPMMGVPISFDALLPFARSLVDIHRLRITSREEIQDEA